MSDQDGDPGRRLLLGHAGSDPQAARRRRPRASATPAARTPTPTYRNHPGHAEAIEIIYDPAQTDYRALLEFFFQIHDPTTKDRQGNDVGTSYRSAIFYIDDEQKRVALDTIADVDASGLWPGKVVTEVTPASRLLGGRAGAPGLPASGTRTGTPATSRGRAGSCRSARPLRSSLSVIEPAALGRRSCSASGVAATHDDPAAGLRRVGDAAECIFSSGAVVGLDLEVPQHRSKHDVHLDVGEHRTDAAPGAAAERQEGERRRSRVDEALRIEASGSAKVLGRRRADWSIATMIE